MAIFFALTVSSATGWFVLLRCLGAVQMQGLHLALRFAAASGLGLLLSSAVYLACLTLGITTLPAVIGCDIALLIAAGLAARSRDAVQLSASTQLPPVAFKHLADRLLGLGLGVAVVVNLVAWYSRFRDEPLGFWDAFAIWNLKARFFYLEAGAHWQRAFSEIITWSHTDYPLLLPLNVARLWLYDGGTSTAAPAFLSAFFTLLVLLLVYGAIASIRENQMAALATLALLATPSLMIQAVWQVADIPMALYLVSSIAFTILALRQSDFATALLFTAGIFAGAAAWTKNEGLLMALAIPTAVALVGFFRAGWAGFTPALHFTKGLVPPLLLLVAMKLGLAGENDLATDFTTSSLSRIFDFARHQLILVSFSKTLFLLAGAPLLTILLALIYFCGVDRTKEQQASHANSATLSLAIAVGLQLAGYYFVYLITERDLAWHLGTSNLRLFVQLWPTVVLLLFATIRPITAALQPDEPKA